MKNLIIIFLLFLVSCTKTTYSDPITVGGKIISRYHKDQKIEYTYHYGYDYSMKLRWHYGPETTPELNQIKFTFLNDTITWNDKALYNHLDSISITYKKVYRDSIFSYNRIIKIE